MTAPALDLDRILAGVDALPEAGDIGSFAAMLTIPGYPAEGHGTKAA
jgi:hypothetical protein